MILTLEEMKEIFNKKQRRLDLKAILEEAKKQGLIDEDPDSPIAEVARELAELDQALRKTRLDYEGTLDAIKDPLWKVVCSLRYRKLYSWETIAKITKKSDSALRKGADRAVNILRRREAERRGDFDN